ncbi:MAG: thiamine diphosphokinase [Lachnospiraceae bacterium]|nr:thiamine diphosphokinase [Lachnospiraceae bacterium]
MSKCILVCAGDLTVGSIPISEGDFVIAVDGGLMYCESLGVEPDLIVGDFDSITESFTGALEEIESKFPEKVVRLNPMKDDTDTMAALKIGIEKGFETFYMYGCGGGRLEHTIANIQSLIYLKDRDLKGYIMEGEGMTFVMRDESVSFKETMEGYVSLFALDPVIKGVTEKGLKYTLEKAELTYGFPLGVSNEFTGVQSEISVDSGTALVVVNWA